MTEEIETIENDLRQAQRDLQQAFSDVSRKIETSERRLLRGSAAVVAVGAAAAAGLWLGSNGRRPLAPAALMLAWMGALWLRSEQRSGRSSFAEDLKTGDGGREHAKADYD